MCGRYASARRVEDLAATFGIDEVDAALPADWNLAPTKPVPTVLARDGRRVLTAARWGLVPSYAPDPSVGARLINARIETVGERPAYRGALAARRCLLPADGWYEWATRPDGGRQPYYLTPPDGAVLAFAGLWEVWYAADGVPLVTTTILTGPAPEDLRTVHDRAPVVLPAASWRAWLDPTTRAPAALLRPTSAGIVAARPVGPQVGDVRAAGEWLTRRVDPPEQPALF